MTIEDSEELNLKFWLLITVRLDSGLLQVEHYADSVLIVVSDQAIMSVGSVGNHVGDERALRYLGFLDDWRASNRWARPLNYLLGLNSCRVHRGEQVLSLTHTLIISTIYWCTHAKFIFCCDRLLNRFKQRRVTTILGQTIFGGDTPGAVCHHG